LETFRSLDQETLRNSLYNVVDQDEESELASVQQFLQFNNAETNDNRSSIQKLTTAQQKLQRVTNCAIHIRNLGVQAKNSETTQMFDQQTLFNEPASLIHEKVLTFRGWLESTSNLVGSECVNDALSHTTANYPNGLEILSENTEPTDIITFLEVFAKHLQEGIEREYTSIAKSFKPNIGRPRLPSVFMIDLSVPVPPRPDNKITVVASPVSLSQPALEQLTIAIAQPPISPSTISTTTIQYREEHQRQLALDWALLAVKAAAVEANLLIFSELFMPECALDPIRKAAQEAKLGVICGVEGNWMDETYSNFANIIIPGLGQDYRQFKKYPSNYEPENFQTKGGQQCFLRSSIGSFSVVLCSDFREFDVIAAIESQPFLDYLIICCCNPYSELWKQIAISDAARLHCFVVVSNWSEGRDEWGYGKDSICVAPTRDIQNLSDQPRFRKVVLTKGSETLSGSLLLHNLDISALYRDREKPKSGYLSPPKRRLHINK